MKGLIVLAAVCLAVMASSGAVAQESSTSWAVPEGARVTVDRQSGSVSIVVPREISDRVGRDARFEEWRKTPYAGTGPFPATRVEDPTLPTHTLYYPAGLARYCRETAGHSLGQWRLSQHIDRVHSVPRRTGVARLFRRRPRTQ